MKLNAGCGRDYRNGYFNIDINPSVKSDALMSAHNLNFEDSFFEEIIALHLIEHLGFFKAKFFLSEAYRTLKDGGILILETPHIEKTFENFIKASDPSQREKILGWVYGSESSYQNHVYCFPLELLDSLIKESGFEIEKTEFYDYEPLRPAVKIYAVKKTSEKANKKSYLRKKALNEGKIDFSDELKAAEFEKTL
ncbi:MAG: methyltransferase domain-containing protein [Elusimicrobia bacterium]|nr:methyltransferase domain-containing protein [Elusimicrobiota bacterium]